jgi:predicted Zn-dependent peptidase
MMSILQTAEGDKAKLVAELKQLKELLDAKIITQAEFDEKKTVLMAKW